MQKATVREVDFIGSLMFWDSSALWLCAVWHLTYKVIFLPFLWYIKSSAFGQRFCKALLWRSRQKWTIFLNWPPNFVYSSWIFHLHMIQSILKAHLSFQFNMHPESVKRIHFWIIFKLTIFLKSFPCETASHVTQE